jgi:N-acyl-D-aspartate/D-glutamate deacylase
MWQNWWSRARVQETRRHGRLVGRTLAEIARERGVSPFDALFDLAIEDEDLATRIEVRVANDDEQELGELLRDRRTVLGLSDAGAHADMLCDASFATYLLQRWVRELGAIPLELAIWRLSGHPAQLLGLRDRGLIREGYVADLVAFDPDRVGALPLERVSDLPAGADRLISRSTGIEHVWVAGTPIRSAGEVIDRAFPGTVIRGSVATH